MFNNNNEKVIMGVISYLDVIRVLLNKTPEEAEEFSKNIILKLCKQLNADNISQIDAIEIITHEITDILRSLLINNISIIDKNAINIILETCKSIDIENISKQEAFEIAFQKINEIESKLKKDKMNHKNDRTLIGLIIIGLANFIATKR
jgi:hypothetical protein